MRTKLFIDFWNFQLAWNELVGKSDDGKPISVPWENQLPKVLCEAVSRKHGEKVTYVGTHVFASIDPTKESDKKLRGFLVNGMRSFPGYDVLVKERRARKRKFNCNVCKMAIEKCPHCDSAMHRSVEKGVDSAILTAMIQMAHDEVYDLGILLSADSDLCNGVEFIQQRLGRAIVKFCGHGMIRRLASFRRR